jgi:hypothetical protein
MLSKGVAYDVITLTWRGVVVYRYEDANCACIWFCDHLRGRLRWLRRVHSVEDSGNRVSKYLDRWLAAKQQPGCIHEPTVAHEPWWGVC